MILNLIINAMKKILFILFAALAFVACEKDGESGKANSSPRSFISPKDIDTNAKAGTVFKFKTVMPTYNDSYRDGDGIKYDTGINKIPVAYPSTYENDYYSLVQTANDTYEVTIKSIEKACTFTLFFRGKEDIGATSGYFLINYTPAE